MYLGQQVWSETTAGTDSGAVATHTAITSRQHFVTSISGHTDRSVINKAINMMPVKSSRALRDAYSAVVPNIDLKRDFNCPHCGTDTRMEVPLSAEFFWPRQ